MFLQDDMGDMKIDELRSTHNKIKSQIQTRLEEFDDLWANGSDEDLFVELAFCLLTPQSKAKNCWRAMERLLEKQLLFNGTQKQIASELSGVRFHNTKAGRIIEARNQFFGDSPASIKSQILEFEMVFDARNWLVKNVRGLGYKEASHFLRNVGRGQNFAILDRHILRNLILFGVIESIPKSLSKKEYFDIEHKMAEFAERVKMPPPHLDLLLWYKETGEIFK